MPLKAIMPFKEKPKSEITKAEMSRPQRITAQELRKRRGMQAVTTVVGLGLVAYGYNHNADGDTKRQEKIVYDALHSSIAKHGRFVVDCTDDFPESRDGTIIESGTTTPDPNNGMVIKLREIACGGVVEYKYKKQQGKVNRKEQLGLMNATHEAEHVRNKLKRNEAETQCFAIQEVPQLAQELGATPRQAVQVQAQILNDYWKILPGNLKDPNCFDGGPLDIDLNHVGQFPYPTP